MPLLSYTMQRNLPGEALDQLYHRFNDRTWVEPDPLQFLYRYEDPVDIETVGLLASSLAYGRVAQIGKSLEGLLSRMGSPRGFVTRTSRKRMDETFAGFQHRWTRGQDVAALLHGIRHALDKHGSLQALFVQNMRQDDANVLPALDPFVTALRRYGGTLLADPCKGSACKRLHLFLRWMVRRDNVDLGLWKKVSPSRLIIPLDTHMHRIGRALGATNRNQADQRTALEITAAFAGLAPEDPVKYDFALTRFGIRNELDFDDWLKKLRNAVIK